MPAIVAASDRISTMPARLTAKHGSFFGPDSFATSVPIDDDTVSLPRHQRPSAITA
ncbi:MAG: hypothetical protein ACRCVA_28675 [Phreatobacter sp.]